MTIRPPEALFETTPWKALSWTQAKRDEYYELARHAIGYGVLFALDRRDKITNKANPINTGLSNIVARSGGLHPSLPVAADPRADLLRLDGSKDNSLWIDRARVFQAAL